MGRGGELALGGVYRMMGTVLPPPTSESAVAIENLAEGKGAAAAGHAARPHFSAVLWRPLQGQPLTRDAVWVGCGLGFRPVRDRGLIWDKGGLNASPAQLLVGHGGFWLANASLEHEELRLSEATLEPGQIAPLANGQLLELAGRSYLVLVA
jgi:hypothetical protein